MPKKPLCVALLWHMHQPDYGNIQTGEIYLPWTRFHAAKDYYDMGALVAGTPGLHLTVNVVPSLMDQLVAYGDGTARETYADLTCRDAAQLREREKYFLLRAFFQLPFKQMVFPYPRYHELLERRGAADESGEYPGGFQEYTTRDYRDLQVWFNLSWCGHELRRNPEIEALFKKGKGFTEEEKRHLIEIQFSFAGKVLPFYRRLMEQHGIELSVSPYYHPILPLLCDNRAARESQPHLPLPASPFSLPADAREQIHRARSRYHQLLGHNAAGLWPSEGSISNMTAALARETGVRWLASDEGVLYNSLQKIGHVEQYLSVTQKFSVYLWGKGAAGPCMFFRDHGMSDLIGFTYARWDAEEAAADFVSRLSQIREALPSDNKHYVVPVILDGENAWEYYPNNGRDFLTMLYRRLTRTEGLRTVTFSEFLALEPHREKLESVVAGSWINANLATWIGHSEKNRGWEFLTAARAFLASRQGETHDRARCEKAFQEMMIAEGSDWFWWYGDDHSTQNAAEFDALFRSHIKNVYRLMESPYPPELDAPIKKADVQIRHRNPVHTITPCIDGKVSDYFEWLAAGFAEPGGGESMHRNKRYLEKIYFGYDNERFYLRIDLTVSRREVKTPPAIELHVQFVHPRELLLSLKNEGKEWRCDVLRSASPGPVPEFAGRKILELGLALENLGICRPEEVRLAIAAYEGDMELERFPAHGYLALTVDPWGISQKEWMV